MEFRQLLSSTAVGVATPDYQSVTSSSGAKPAATAGPTGYTPQEIQQAYGFNQVTLTNGAAGNGAGTTIAIVDAYDDPNIASDLHHFDLTFGLPDPTLIKVNQTGGSAMPIANGGWITEIALDVEWAHAIAPAANILLVEANTNSLSDLMTAVGFARQASGVDVVSMSWGAGEFSAETSFDSAFTTPAGHNGVSFVVSSGDRGSPISFPASSPNVLSVGGTSLYLNQGSYSTESGWSGSGGGISAYEAQPSYQNGTVTQSLTQRTNPDVSYDSNPATGFPVYDSYNNGSITPWGQWGGTSDAAPQWSALIAIADQDRALNGLGSLDGRSQLLPALYQLPAADFHDVTTGGSTGSPAYNAGPGYDLVTGRGTPVANLIIPGLLSKSTTSPPTHLNVSAPATILAGTSFNLTVSALDASNSISTTYLGTIVFTTTDLATGVVLPGSYTFKTSDNGIHTFSGVTLTTLGTQSITIKDTATGSLTQTISLVVTGPNAPPVLSGNSAITYVKNQAAAAINPVITLIGTGSSAVSSAAVTILNVISGQDLLSFINNNSSLYGNIAANYQSATGTLTLTSVGATATLAQFQSALRAVTYFNNNGNSATLGTRTVQFVVASGGKISNAITSSVTIANASTTTTLSASSSLYSYGQSVRLVATVAVVSPGIGIPSAAVGVTFRDGSDLLSGSVVYSIVNTVLTATLTTSALSLGSHSITASYNGDANNAASTSMPFAIAIGAAGTTCVVSPSAMSTYYGNPLTLTAVVGTLNREAIAPTVGGDPATVVFRDGINVIAGTVTYSAANGNLIATLTTTALTAGSHILSAIYSGNSQFARSISTTLFQPVYFAHTATTITSSATSATVGQSVTLTATIGVAGIGAGIPTVGTPTTNVQFMDGNVVLKGSVTYKIVNGNLVATLTTTSLSVGTHSIKAVYSGDTNFSASSSVSLKLVINPH